MHRDSERAGRAKHLDTVTARFLIRGALENFLLWAEREYGIVAADPRRLRVEAHSLLEDVPRVEALTQHCQPFTGGARYLAAATELRRHFGALSPLPQADLPLPTALLHMPMFSLGPGLEETHGGAAHTVPPSGLPAAERTAATLQPMDMSSANWHLSGPR
jgi:hypothetical protein